MYLDLDYIEKNDAYNTYYEIFQQAEKWREVYRLYEQRKEKIEEFLAKVGSDVKIIFTGAGSSEYVGNILNEYLKSLGTYNFSSVATTDLVSCPYLHFAKNQKTLLVSFARSGNSPESLAAVKLGEQIVDDFYNMAITCAPDGKLALKLKDDEKSFVFIEPEGTNDKGFAMTSSFTSMLLTGLLIFDKRDDKKALVDEIVKTCQEILADKEKIEDLVNFDFDRIIYLGSGPLYRLTDEARLKILELTAGKVASLYESSMGFRHGPKSFVNDKTLVVSFVSSNPYTSQYDLDILDETYADKIAQRIIAIANKEIAGDFEKLLYKNQINEDIYLALPYIVIAQLISLITSLRVGNTPDNPSKSGTVNRVVKGVSIHEYEK
ncbi:SIS domain-containing protein [Anaerococcus sp. Marseille-P3625]|uniref:SIS domain-containing protein n=1 Tax=Anaerococcus sp. Marseille-P3625 TaxID=1977277 RepID=UPI000C085006|nr:SIS domain-containing protein [Anaerococcus sp. Marseille-P3625]